ncbi:MAG: KH domain-containing protein [Coriobacteriia bacterium]|nr:KH domain-containing protein [Coriobacteriia bacterium]
MSEEVFEHPSDQIAELVEYLVVSLVDEPDEVAIDITDSDENTTLIEVSVSEDDIGKIIGRKGRIIKAIRTLAHACGARKEINCEVEVIG